MTKFGTYMRIDLGMVPTKKNGPTCGPEGWAHWGHSSKRVLSWRAASNPSRGQRSLPWQRAVSQAAWGIVTNKLAANTHVIGRKTQIAQCAASRWSKPTGETGEMFGKLAWWAIRF